MLSSTDNNFMMICLFDFERFSIESRFPFLKLIYQLRKSQLKPFVLP